MPDLLPPVRVLYIVLPNDPTEDELFGYAGVVDRLRPRQLLYSDDHPEALYLSYGTASAAEKAFKLCQFVSLFPSTSSHLAFELTSRFPNIRPSAQQTWCPLFIPDTAVPPDLDTWDIEYDVENKEMRAGLRSEQGDSLDSMLGPSLSGLPLHRDGGKLVGKPASLRAYLTPLFRSYKLARVSHSRPPLFRPDLSISTLPIILPSLNLPYAFKPRRRGGITPRDERGCC